MHRSGREAQRQTLLHIAHNHSELFTQLMSKEIVGDNEGTMRALMNDNQLRESYGLLAQVVRSSLEESGVTGLVMVEAILNGLNDNNSNVSDFLEVLFVNIPREYGFELLKALFFVVVDSAIQNGGEVDAFSRSLLDTYIHLHLLNNVTYARKLIDALRSNPISVISLYLLKNAEYEDFAKALEMEDYDLLGDDARTLFQDYMTSSSAEGEVRYVSESEAEEEPQEEEQPHVPEVVDFHHDVDELGNAL